MFDGAMYLRNGYVNADTPVVRDLWRSIDGSNWEEVLSETPYDGHAAIAVHNDKIFAAKTTVWRSSNDKDWQRITSNGPSDDDAASGKMVSFKGKLWFFEVDQVASSTDGVEWQHHTAPYRRRSGAAVVADEQFLYVMGGSIFAPNSPPERSYPNRPFENVLTFDMYSLQSGQN